MGTAKYLLAVASVFLLGTAAGAFVHHPKDGSGYGVPIVLAVLGLIAAFSAWTTHRGEARPSKSIEGESLGDAASHERDSDEPGR
jgi:hypothetical protein